MPDHYLALQLAGAPLAGLSRTCLPDLRKRTKGDRFGIVSTRGTMKSPTTTSLGVESASTSSQSRTQIPKTSRVAATPENFPCGPTPNAKRHIRSAFQKSSDARSTITTFQRDNSLHCMFAKAFGTIPIHQKNIDGISVEPLDPSPVLEFLSHLNVTRHEVHSRVAAALRSSIEDEIQRMPLPSSGSSSSVGEIGHAALLNLLKSAWQFRDVPELRPILVCLLKRLGDHTPVQVLRRLGVKKTAEKDGKARKDGELKNAELLAQLGPHISRLVWEANWDERMEAVTASLSRQNTAFSASLEQELTLRGSTILADLISPSVQSYLSDPILVQAADLSFVATSSERRFATKTRRMKAVDPGHVGGGSVGALTSIGVSGPSGGGDDNGTHPGTAKAEKSDASSAAAIASIKETIGSRPKLLGALLDMLIAEYALTGGGLAHIKTMSISDKKQEALKDCSSIVSILGGSTNLSCSLVSDILLTYGQLPRSYEVLGIMARILDASVQAGSISDIAIVQVQGCLRSIFRPEQVDNSQSPQKAVSEQEAAGGPKIKLSLKAAKNPSSMFPDLPVDDSEYEKKILQLIVKAAITSMKANDSQGLFLNPVTDVIAPGYSSLIKEPMCIRTMEEKMMASQYKTIEEFKDDTMLMFSNCVTYNVGPAGVWFRGEAARQKKLWKENIYSEAKTKLKTALDKRKKALKQAKAAETGGSSGGTKKRKPPPPLAFGLADKSAKIGAPAGSAASKETKDDAAINNLTINDVDPLPPWSKRRKKVVDSNIPNMQCLAAMLLADPFVLRILLDKILRTIRADVKEKRVPCGNTLLPSMFQLMNIAHMSIQLCATKGMKYSIPDAGIFSTATNSMDESLSFKSIRQYLPLFSKMLLDVEIDRRIVSSGDLHDAFLQGLIAHPDLQIQEWKGTSSLHDLKVVVEGAFVSLLFPGNTNEIALRHQFPRFVAALDALSGGNMLNERPFFMSLTSALLRYKTKLPHGTRDLVTGCLVKWLRMGYNIPSETRLCSALHEALVNLLNEWSSLGNIVLPRDLLLNLAEEAVAAAAGCEVGEKCALFVKLWNDNDDMFSRVKEQYLRMLSSAPLAKSNGWKEKMGIMEPSLDQALDVNVL
ncbi:hypothetical protein HJC23_007108 [Cyclotella cryptica]|uniref:Bromo domain-containing protein n=1 Tax=Cyclotella cryptica TaxID=29204 RepID=A0ABD3P107_9STRA|eukprot:CCRYP_018374-RB/>CCRYP_018374-RB protein AED:0.03 eAED:0.03 QI:78/1/1/1/1/1/5/476/1112